MNTTYKLGNGKAKIEGKYISFTTSASCNVLEDIHSSELFALAHAKAEIEKKNNLGEDYEEATI